MLTEYYFAVRYGDIIILLYHEDMMSVWELLFKNSQKEKVLFGNPPPILYGSFFINYHCKIQNQVNNQVIPDDNQ